MEGVFPDQFRKELAAYIDDLLMYVIRHADMLPILDRTWVNSSMLV